MEYNEGKRLQLEFNSKDDLIVEVVEKSESRVTAKIIERVGSSSVKSSVSDYVQIIKTHREEKSVVFPPETIHRGSNKYGTGRVTFV